MKLTKCLTDIRVSMFLRSV